jgi:hypothetical protein
MYIRHLAEFSEPLFDPLVYSPPCSVAPSVDENGSFCEWVTRQPSAFVVLKLPGKHLLSTLVIHNKSTSVITVKIGLRAKKGG